ncbi:MAG TPA: hypothetical protein VGQ65_24875 [Thermoanaerobaculia bacterium]|nr:hypothetical protein [Thermoanaerobaculia bacterium]
MKFGQCSEELPAELPKPGRIQMRRDAVESARGWKMRLRAYLDQQTTCASVTIDDVARPIFTRDLGAAFDVLLIAREDGTVLYSIRPPPASSTLLGNQDEWIVKRKSSRPSRRSNQRRQ